MRIVQRIVLSLVVIFCVASCEADDPSPTYSVAPALTEAVPPAPLPPDPVCGIWWGASAIEADARSNALPFKPDAKFYTRGYSTCVDAILACSVIQGMQPGRFCQVRYTYESLGACGEDENGLGTSPSGPVEGADDDPTR